MTEEKISRHKKYYLKNKEKIAIRKKKYNEENKERLSQKAKEYYLRVGKEKKLARNKAYKLENKEKIAEKSKEYRLKNLEKIKLKQQEFYQRTKEDVLKKKKKQREEARALEVQNLKVFIEEPKSIIKKYHPDKVLVNCLNMCDTEIDIIKEDGGLKDMYSKRRYLYGQKPFDNEVVGKFNPSFIDFFFANTRHKELFKGCKINSK